MVSLGTTPAAAATDLLPDLVQAVPSQVQIGGSSTSGWQIGFQSEVMNKGAGALEIQGHRSSTADPMIAEQVIYQSSPGETRTVSGVGTLHYETGFGHHHWHFEPFDHYELRKLDGTLVGTDVKQGFCLGDNRREGSTSGAVYGTSIDPTWCQQNNPDALQVTEGISVGWGDPYDPLKEGQDIPIDQATVPAGDYNLVHRVNENTDGTPGPVLEESFGNNVASDWVRIAWSNGTPSVAVIDSCPSTASCGPVPPPPSSGGGGGGSSQPQPGTPGGSGSSPPQPTGGALAAGPVGAVAEKLRFRHLVSVASLLRHGLRARVHCSKACRIRLTLKTPDGLSLSTTTGSLHSAGSTFLRLRLKPMAKQLLRRDAVHRLSLQLSVKGRDGIRRTLTRSLLVRS